MKLPRLVPPFLLVFFNSISQLSAQETYHLTQLPILDYYSGSLLFGYGSGTAYGLNDSADVVTQSGILYSGGGATGLPSVYPPPQYYGSRTTPWDVNNSGVVVGHGGSEYFDGYSTNGSYQHGFLYASSGSTMTDAGLLPGGLESRLFAINNAGTAAGWSQRLDGSILRVQAATFSGGVLTNVHNSVRLSATDVQSAIFGITDTGKLAGYSISAGGAYQAFSYNGSTSASLGNFDGTNSVALGLSDSATVGWAENAAGLRQAFVHDGTNLINLDATFTGSLASSTTGSAAAAINDAGTIVGQAWQWFSDYPNYDGSINYYNSQAFVSDGTNSQALTNLVNSSNPWKVVSASDINASGQIAATATLDYYSNAVVLTPETAWTATGDGTWDTAANWKNSTIPGANGAAFLNLADGVTVTGPAEDHTLYALTVGSTGTSATLQLQAGSLTVRGDTELRAGGIIDATATALETSYLHGSGTVSGELNAGYIYTRSSEHMRLSGNVTATGILVSASSTIETSGNVTADNIRLGGGTNYGGARWVTIPAGTEIGGVIRNFDYETGSTFDQSLSSQGILRVSGSVHAAISGSSGSYLSSGYGRIQLTGNATLGGTDIAPSVNVKQLELGGHSATLLTSGNATHNFQSIDFDGGQIIAPTGISLRVLGSGSGAVTGDVTLSGAILQPGVGGNLNITGNLSGSGMLVGPNIQISGTTTAGSSRAIVASVDLGTENAMLFGNGTTILGGQILMNGGTLTATNGIWLGGSITGSGSVSGPIAGSGTITANGTLALGDASSSSGVNLTQYTSSYDYVDSSGTLNAGNSNVTLLDSDYASIRNVNLAGGAITAANGLEASLIMGYGAVSGPVSAGSIIASGNLTLGNASSADGVSFRYNMSVGAHTVTLLDSDAAVQGGNNYGYGAVTLSGGTLNAANGLVLASRTNVLASGSNATSSINGNLTIANSVVEATDGNSLAINGTLSGFGVLLGNVTATSFNATAGDVVLSNTLDVGSRSMTVIAQSRAMLGQATTLAGGTIGASNGLGLASGHAITGHGIVNPGAGQSLQLAGGILDAQAGQALAINGDLEGYGVTIGSVTVSGNNTMASAPSGQVVLGRNLDVGNRAAVFHSNATAVINSKVSLAGGSLSSGNGITNTGEVSGYGTIASNVNLQSGVINASDTGIAISGSLGGYGIVVGNVSATTNTLTTPTGIASISSVDIGSRTGTVYSSGRASIGALVSQGGTLNTGVHGANINRYEGHGTLAGNVHMDGGLYLVDVSSTLNTLNITGAFTGYGIVAGTHTPMTAAPTGTVNYNYAWNIGRSDITVYSQGVPKVQEVNLQTGAYIYSAQGWEFGNLAGGGTIGGNVTIKTILSPGFSPGTIIFKNDLTLAMASSTVLEFAGTGDGQYDFLDIAEAFTMGGNLQVNFLSGFDPGTGLLPEWFDADNNFSGTFSNITWSGLGSGKSVTFNSGTGRLGIAEISNIPEVSTLAFILPAAGVLLLKRRRARQS